MSWHFSRGLVEAYLEENSLGGEQSALSKTIPMPEQFSVPDKTMDACHLSPSGMTFAYLMEGDGLEWWISSLADSPARILAQRGEGDGKGFLANEVDFGERWGVLLGRYDHDLSLWKTAQLSLFEDWGLFLEIWPRWGMMQNGGCFLLEMLAHDTSVREYGSWPIIGTPIKTQRSRSEDFMGQAKNPFELSPKGYLPNPSWVEDLMGWPTGWTDLKESAMGKFQQWWQRYGIFSPHIMLNKS
jgi:hypothetical protein